jgi:predicted transcriptional regulator
MATQERKDLFVKANALSLDFPKNVSTPKLIALIAESEGPSIKEEPVNEEIAEVITRTAPSVSNTISPLQERRNFIAVQKRKAMKTRLVTITNNDSRENDFATCAPLSFENQHFGVAKNVPLDVKVELEQALIDIAESTTITKHKDEIVNGKRTGNKVPVSVKKFVVSYARE